MCKLRNLPDDVLRGLKKSTSPTKKPNNLENFNNALDALNDAALLPLFGKTTKPSEFRRLEMGDAKYIRLNTGGFRRPK